MGNSTSGTLMLIFLCLFSMIFSLIFVAGITGVEMRVYISIYCSGGIRYGESDGCLISVDDLIRF